MRRYLFLIIIFIFSLTLPVSALTYKEIESRNVCSNYELAIAKADKTLQSVKCFDNYNSALTEMNNTNNDDLVILERKNNKTKVVNAKYALVYLNVRNITENTNYYSDSSLKSALAYMNHHINYGATDGVFLDMNIANHAAKIKSNGVVGWVKEDYYKIIPLNFVGTTSYYKVLNGELYHYYGGNIETNYSAYGRVIDKKPSYLNQGSYYSFDGIYFYNSLKTLIGDYKNNNYNNSLNKNNPYYNYYMYLPHRGLSNYTNDEIDSYLKNSRGLIGTIYGNKVVSHYSNMYQTGIFFKSSEYLYGANAILMLSLATNESALGQSTLAIFKNNLFGHNAVDSDAYDSATGYLNPYQSIIGHAKSYINCGYANPNDYRYRGSNMGNKTSGMNIQYASDPYWGEKAANYYYLFDKENGFKDYNYYQLGITNSTFINVRTDPNTVLSSIPFNLKYQNVPVIILGEVDGEKVNGSTKWYKIASDMNLNANRTAGVSCTYENHYNLASYVYVHSSLINKINTTFNGKYNSIPVSTYKNYTYKEYSNGANYKPVSGRVNKDTTVYDTATMSVSSNKTIKTGHLVSIFMEAKEGDKTIGYLVQTDYSKNQKGWVKASDVTLTNKDLLKVSLNKAGAYLNLYNTPGGSVLGSIYTNTYSVIVDKKEFANNLWLKIHYGLDNTYAWLNTNISETMGSLTYTLNYLNQPPVIKANDLKISKYASFDPKKGITVTDAEDGNLIDRLQITKNNVDTKKAGTYQVTYQVTDNNNQTTTKTITVTVVEPSLGKSLFMYENLTYLKDNIFLFKGFLGVKKMDNINLIHELIFVNEDTKEEYHFSLGKYPDYPYEMSSLDDDKPYNYQGGWFKGEIDLSKEKIKEGNYLVYIVAYNLDKNYYAKEYFTNIAYLEMARRIDSKTRGFALDVDYSTKGSPLIISIRDRGLLSYDIPTSMDPMYNFFNEIKLSNNNLTITGTSHSIGSSYSKKDDVKREMIFENTKTYERYSYDIGYIDNGLYQVTLPVSDNLDKTRAWYQKTIDLTKLEKGLYAIYLKTTSNSKTYYGELIDVAYTDFTKINTNKYKFSRNDLKRLRLELEVK